jgi:hypothetical protein
MMRIDQGPNKKPDKNCQRISHVGVAGIFFTESRIKNGRYQELFSYWLKNPKPTLF